MDFSDIREVASHTAREAVSDNVAGEAAKVAYYFFLSFFPLILGLFALTGIAGGDDAFDWIMARLQELLPRDATRLLEGGVRELTEQRRPDLLSLGVLLTARGAESRDFADGVSLRKPAEPLDALA